MPAPARHIARPRRTPVSLPPFLTPLAALCLALLTSIGGCVSVYLPTHGSAQPIELAQPGWPAPELWPARSPMWSGLKRATIQAGGRPRGTVLTSNIPSLAMGTDPDSSSLPGASQADRAARELRDDANTLMVRRDTRTDPRAWGNFVSVTSEGKGSFVFVRASPAGARSLQSTSAGEPAFSVRFLSGRDRSPDPSQPDRIAMQMERTWLAFYDPLNPDGSALPSSPNPASRGTIVLIPGMFGTPSGTIDDLVGVLRREGWSVLRLLAHPSRFTERLRVEVPTTDPAALARTAAEVATELADRASECAYAVHAGLLALRERRPALTDKPRLVVGLSGGAMVIPAVIAYRPADFSGAILIGGGVGYLRIALESSYSGWIDALSFVAPGGDALSREQREQFLAAYDAAAPLDSVRLAPILRGRPTLILHAAGDSAVPAATGDQLWELAGRPERWTFSTGHELLFFMLPSAMPRMIRWLDEHFPQPAPPTAPPSSRAEPIHTLGCMGARAC